MNKVLMTNEKTHFVVRYVMFDPLDKALSLSEVKDMARKEMHISKDKIKDEYVAIYAQAYKDRIGRKKATFFKPCTKIFANCVFIIPNKYKKVAKKEISEYFFV